MQAKTLAVILAAGEGTRMKSAKPKVLHSILGRSLLSWVVGACADARIDELVCVVGNQAQKVEEACKAAAAKHGIAQISVVEQKERKGTGHALMVAKEILEQSDAQNVLVVSADSPLLKATTLEKLIAMQQSQALACALLSFNASNPFGYGRILRTAQGDMLGIVEEKDASLEEKKISEANAGVYVFDKSALLYHLSALSNDNAQGEYYLTDMLSILLNAKLPCGALMAEDETEALGVNNRVQLAHAAKVMQRRINEAHMLAGVTMWDPDSVFIEADVTIMPDVELLPQVILEGNTHIESNCVIGPQTRIESSYIGEASLVEESIVVQSRVEDRVSIGPRAYLRPETHMKSQSKAGTHVEIKKSVIGKGSKIPHLSYVGDAVFGEGVNLGAGSITCNYDGFKKHKTVVGDQSFIGSDTMLVAPVSIGNDVIVAAGSTITEDVPDDALAIARSKQVNKEAYVSKLREKLQANTSE